MADLNFAEYVAGLVESKKGTGYRKQLHTGRC